MVGNTEWRHSKETTYDATHAGRWAIKQSSVRIQVPEDKSGTQCNRDNQSEDVSKDEVTVADFLSEEEEEAVADSEGRHEPATTVGSQDISSKIAET